MKHGFIGIGYINPNSLIAVRLLTREMEAIDGAFFRKRVLNALSYRKSVGIDEILSGSFTVRETSCRDDRG